MTQQGDPFQPGTVFRVPTGSGFGRRRPPEGGPQKQLPRGAGVALLIAFLVVVGGIMAFVGRGVLTRRGDDNPPRTEASQPRASTPPPVGSFIVREITDSRGRRKISGKPLVLALSSDEATLTGNCGVIRWTISMRGGRLAAAQQENSQLDQCGPTELEQETRVAAFLNRDPTWVIDAMQVRLVSGDTVVVLAKS